MSWLMVLFKYLPISVGCLAGGSIPLLYASNSHTQGGGVKNLSTNYLEVQEAPLGAKFNDLYEDVASIKIDEGLTNNQKIFEDTQIDISQQLQESNIKKSSWNRLNSPVANKVNQVKYIALINNIYQMVRKNSKVDKAVNTKWIDKIEVLSPQAKYFVNSGSSIKVEERDAWLSIDGIQKDEFKKVNLLSLKSDSVSIGNRFREDYLSTGEEMKKLYSHFFTPTWEVNEHFSTDSEIVYTTLVVAKSNINGISKEDWIFLRKFEGSHYYLKLTLRE